MRATDLMARVRQWMAPGTKSMGTMVHDGRGSMLGTFFEGLLPATNRDYARDVGDGLGSSVLAGPLNWIMRTFPEAPPVVERLRQQQWNAVDDHDLVALLQTPNPFYGGRTLWMATVLDFCFGNAYWLKIRNGVGEVIQLWWVPRQLLIPRWPLDGSSFIDHYDYLPGGRTIPIRPEDVVHFRFGLDPRNPRLGLSPLGALLREVGIDDTAANFTGSILRNLGIIGVIVSPEGAGTVASRQATEEVKEYIRQNFTGDKRGDTLAVGAPTKAQVLQYNLQGFDVGPLRDVSEERVCAALGIPAAVVGFGTGLQQTKVGATMKEMRQLAWTGGVIPMQEIIADELRRSLLPEFETRLTRTRIRFDSSKVRALWEDQNEKHDRVRKDWMAGLITRAEARTETGRPAGSEDDVYIDPQNMTRLGGATLPPAPADQPTPPPEDSADVTP